MDQAGAYMVSLSLNVPCNTSLHTVLTIRLNGEAVPGGTLVIDKEASERPLSAGKQAVIYAGVGSVLTVTSSEPINLMAESAVEAIASLTVVKIS